MTERDATVTIEPATADDAAGLAELAAATFGLACPPSMDPQRIRDFIATNLTTDSFARYLGDDQRFLLVARETGASAAMVGYTMLVTTEPSDPDVAMLIADRPAIELSKCYALPEYHGTGAAARLMGASLEWAWRQGARCVWLGVNQQNVRAQKFYQRHGFTLAGPRRFQVGEQWEDDFVLVAQAPSSEESATA